MTATTRTDIAAFLTAQLDADEAAARAAPEETPWHAQGAAVEGFFTVPASAYDDATAAHIARHDPAHALARVAGLRALVELHKPVGYEEDDGPDVCITCQPVKDGWAGCAVAPCPTLRAIASIWKDAPTFDARWAE